MREPLARLEILLLKRRIQDTQPPYLSRRRRIIAFYISFGFAVRGLQGEGTCSLFTIALAWHTIFRKGRFMGRWMESTHLLLVVQTLVVVFEDGCAFCFARVVFGGCVGRVACEDFLPEGEAAGWA